MARTYPDHLWITQETYDIAATADRPPSIAVATAGFPLKDALVKTIRYGVLIKTENVTDGSAGL
jgi:hypothetical protein